MCWKSMLQVPHAQTTYLHKASAFNIAYHLVKVGNKPIQPTKLEKFCPKEKHASNLFILAQELCILSGNKED